MVSLSGRIFTARDRVHRYLSEGGASPVELADGAIYHCGPVVVRREQRWVVRSAGPTTSMRQERYMAGVVESHGVRVIVGKGGMGEATRKACARCGCIYVQVIGGCAAALASRVVDVREVHFLDEFGPTEAIWVLEIRDMRGVVSMDTRGRSLHKRIRAKSQRALRELFAAPPVV